MRRLGYTRYVAQGGCWGVFVVAAMGIQAPQGLLAIHTNKPGTVPADIDKAAFARDAPPARLSADSCIKRSFSSSEVSLPSFRKKTISF